MRIRHALGSALVMCAAACGGPSGTLSTSQPQPQAQAQAVAGFEPAPLYAVLFEPGHEWVYEGFTESFLWDEMDPDADESGNVNTHTDFNFTCIAEEVRSYPSAILVEVSCASEDEQTVQGVYAANAAGLWRVPGMLESAEELVRIEEGTFLVPPVPEALEETETYDEYGGMTRALDQTNTGDWCRSEFVWGGDESGWTLCFGEGIGITSASESWAGGSSTETAVYLTSGPPPEGRGTETLLESPERH